MLCIKNCVQGPTVNRKKGEEKLDRRNFYSHEGLDLQLQSLDTPNIKTTLVSPDFKYRSPWIHGWIPLDLPRRQLQPICTEAGRLPPEKMTITDSRLNHLQEQGYVGNDQNSQNDAIVALLKTCAEHKDLHQGSKIHADIVTKGLLEKNVYIGSALVNMYAKCCALEKAQEALDELPVRNVVSWTALIAGYVQHGHGEKALNCFEKMQHEGFSPNAVTFACILKACGSIGDAIKGQELHDQIVKECLLEKNVVVANALIDMYVKCGLLGKAQEILDELPIQNLISWTTLIAGYAQHGHGEKALKCYEKMQLRGFSPNAVTFACILKACSDVGALDVGQEIHAKIVKAGLLEKDIVVATALVDMYSKCGVLGKAQEVFDELSLRNVVAWTALTTGYAQHGCGEEALNCFEQMLLEGLSPDVVTFACILKVCGSIGAAYKGQQIHAEIVSDGLLEKALVVGTALVDMYANSGMLEEAQEVFNELLDRDVVLWNTLLAGCSQLGKHQIVFDLFHKMLGEGQEPNLVTFTFVLNACSHEGLLEKGQMYFETISKGFLIMPNLEHHTCMVDLFGRAGLLGEGLAVVKGMSFPADFPLWQTLLSVCQKWRNMKVGRWAFEHAANYNEKDAVAYVSMSSLFVG